MHCGSDVPRSSWLYKIRKEITKEKRRFTFILLCHYKFDGFDLMSEV